MRVSAVLWSVALVAACSGAGGRGGNQAASAGSASSAAGSAGTSSSGNGGSAGASDAPNAGGASGAAGNGGNSSGGGGSPAQDGKAGSAGSASTGGTGGGGVGGAGGGPVMPSGTPTILLVGYGGLRIVSRDYGKTWVDRVSIINEQYGNETYLLRNAIFAQGLFIAIGTTIYTSPEGTTWTERKNPVGTQWLGGIAVGNGIVVAVGGCGEVVWSADGMTWQKGDKATNQNCPTGSHRRSAAFGDGQFAMAGDDNIVYASPNARAWKVYPGLQTGDVAYCNGAFRTGRDCPPYRGSGPYTRLSARSVSFSVDNKTWMVTHTDTNQPTEMIYGYP